ncbi:CHAT domain-containing protein [Chitinophaga horti]|uniref:CHAT domain-containing protein n=1 Tax=Chitinophaga horti TaxID=2920382 RepID=A0ABY6J3V7_9BACT|nr:CHAT domain-containing protein [Chitinophaga horti]UYQ94353.1 CHAT domain-containing protein [Chitinophaga horti]
MKVTSIVVKGYDQTNTSTATPSGELLTLKKSIAVSGPMRGVASQQQVPLDPDDVVELIFEDETTWICGPDTLDEVFPEVALQARGTSSEMFELPVGISAPGAERGLFGKVLIKLVNVFSKKKVTVVVKDLAADLERKQLENFSGLYRLDDEFKFLPFEQANPDKPYFIFLHGTASSTKRSFGDLQGTEVWAHLRQTYGDNLLAFQHESLTKSPLLNALQLVQALPQRATLHLMSQSRGGLIGDILCRFCTTDDHARGFTEQNLQRLRDENDRNHDLQMIAALQMELSNKQITVEKFIRSACPADGTTLASRRLDNVLNMLFNIVGIGTAWAGSPVYLAFKGLISNVISAKNDVNTLPGLEAMNRQSPFIEVLNHPVSGVVVDTPLTIIAGNCKAKFNLKALLVIASKLFFLKKNDLIVDTESMYKTPVRSGLVQVFFDEGTDVDHFSYFKNDRTRQKLLMALQAQPNVALDGFALRGQTALAAEERNAALGLEGGQVYKDKVSGSRPIAVILPGIMGTNLSQDDILIWINYFGMVSGQLKRLNIKGENIKAHSLVRTSYLDLARQLEKQYDVVTFAFDWRLQLNESASLFNDKINELLKYRQPIKLVAHSMGGVLVRDFIISFPDTWRELNASAGFRLLFLGAPLGGSFRIPAVLFGEDAIIEKLNKVDIFHSKKQLLKVFAQLPGILSLLPLNTDSDNDFEQESVWEEMRAAYGDKEWPIPSAADRKVFAAYRNYINEQMPLIDFTNAVYIAGKDKATPSGYRIDDTSKGKRLVFLSTAEGDQSVTWDSGIPKKMVEANTVYYANVTHGGLSCDKSIFRAIEDILSTGVTNLLSRNRPIVRGDEKVFRMPDRYDFDLSPTGIMNTLMGIEKEETTQLVQVPVEVTVSKGDLRYASFPLLAGHFQGDGILYAEEAVNANLKGALTQRHALGLYPGKIGSSEIVITSEQSFKGAIIVGLGEMNKLTAYQLAQTVEQAVSRYLLDLNTRGPQGSSPAQKLKQVGLSSLVIGCGYGGLSVQESVKAILRGVANANAKISRLYEGDARLIEHFEFVEQYEDRALSTYYAVRNVQNDNDRLVNINLSEQKVQLKPGYMQRIAADPSSGWWTRITVALKEHLVESATIRSLQFTVATDGSRQEQRFLLTTRQIIEQLVDEISENNNWTPSLAKSIFELLIPNDFKELLKKQGHIMWILDKTTAAYPWELLQDSVANAQPLCVNGGMVRQLATQDSETRITAVTNNQALVIGDPDLRGFVAQLRGAQEEGRMVAEQLVNNGYEVKDLINSSASAIIEAMFSSEYKIIHLAGHGVFNEDPGQGSGMLIGYDTYLSTREVGQMSAAPELVFVNCCYLGKTDAATEELFRYRYKLAANIGTQLIENGVKAVIVAGWAVDDAAALKFTEIFYNRMFEGQTFGDAIRAARSKVFEEFGHTNTWGAYQCYGDPFYRILTSHEAFTHAPLSFAIPEEAVVALSNLANSLETGIANAEKVKAEMLQIDTAVDAADVRTAEITEREAFIYSELMEYEAAIAKYDMLVKMEDTSFSVAAMERYSRVRIQKCIYDHAESAGDAKDALRILDEVTEDLSGLLRLGATVERYLLLGTATRFKAMLKGGQSERVQAAKLRLYEDAAYYYYKAWSLHNNANAEAAIVPLVEMELLLQMLTGSRKWGAEVEGRHGQQKEVYYVPGLEVIQESLKSRLSTLENLPAYKRTADHPILLADIDLCWYVLSPTGGSEAAYTKMLEAYTRCWAQRIRKSNAYVIRPHLRFLLDALSVTKKTAAVKWRKQLTEMVEKLEKLA